MGKIHIMEIAAICGGFGLKAEILEPEDNSGPVLILTGGLPGPEIIREINRRIHLLEPNIRKILLEIPNDGV